MQDRETAVLSWVAAWNSHSVERIVSHYSQDAVLVTETAVTRWNRPDGRLRGKDDLRRHFAAGLKRAPQLRFKLNDILWAPGGYAVLYERENGNSVVDAMTVDEQGLITHATAYYKHDPDMEQQHAEA